MSKYAVNEDGVQALQTVASCVVESVSEILNLANKMEASSDEKAETLGPHKSSLLTAISQIKDAQKQATEPAREMSDTLKDIAQSYAEIIANDRITTKSGQNSSADDAGLFTYKARRNGQGNNTQGSGVSPTNQILAGKTSAFDSNADKLGNDFVNGMQNTLNKSSHDDVKKVYEKYGSQLQVKDANHSGGAFYRHGDGVYMNKDIVSKGDMIHEPYQTAFHEFGHNIDYIMGNGKPISETWNNGELMDAIRDDFSSLRGTRTNEELVAALKEEMARSGWSIKEVGSVSDIVESMTGISYPLGVGHGSSYWNGRLPCKEFFAETLDGAASNEGSYGFIKKMFPRAVAVVHKILGGDL